MNKRNLLRAAASLRREARAIKESHQRGDDEWFTSRPEEQKCVDRDRRDHDEMLDLAAKLETCAKTGDSCTRPARRVKETTA